MIELYICFLIPWSFKHVFVSERVPPKFIFIAVTIVSKETCKPSSRKFRSTIQRLAINVVKSKPFFVTMYPFKVVHQGPYEISSHIGPIPVNIIQTKFLFWYLSSITIKLEAKRDFCPPFFFIIIIIIIIIDE